MKQEQIYKKRLRLLLVSALFCLFAFMAAIALQGVFVLLFGAAFAFLAGHLFCACHIGAYEVGQLEALLKAEMIKSDSSVSQTVAGVAIETENLFEEPEDKTFEVTGDDEHFIRQSLEASTYRRPKTGVASLSQVERDYGRASGI